MNVCVRVCVSKLFTQTKTFEKSKIDLSRTETYFFIYTLYTCTKLLADPKKNIFILYL